MSLQPNRPPPELTLVNEAPAHGAEIEALLNRAFGPGRFAKVSERVREFADFAPELSFCAIEAGKVVGVVRRGFVDEGELRRGPVRLQGHGRSLDAEDDVSASGGMPGAGAGSGGLRQRTSSHQKGPPGLELEARR